VIFFNAAIGNLDLKLLGELAVCCTSDKVADIAWLSDAFIHEFSYTTPYPKAPEICVEIVSPSNSKIEINQKIDLYLAKGAHEVWIVYDLNTIEFYTHAGKIDSSKFVVL
jgi:Uma2 family endonuclease